MGFVESPAASEQRAALGGLVITKVMLGKVGRATVWIIHHGPAWSSCLPEKLHRGLCGGIHSVDDSFYIDRDSRTMFANPW